MKISLHHLLVCMLFFCCSIASAQQTKKYTDSLYSIVVKNKTDTNTANAVTALQKFYFTRAMYDSSLKYSLKALNMAKQLNDIHRIARSLYRVGISYASLTRYDSSAFYFDECYKYMKEVKDDELLVEYYNGYATLYNYQSNNAKAIEYMLKCSDVLEKNNDPKLKHLLPQTYGNIGYLFDLEKQFDKAIFYHHKAYENRQFVSDTTHLIMLHLNLFLAYINNKKIAQSKPFLDSAAMFNKNFRNMETEVYIQNNYGFYYENLKDSTKALPFYLKAYALCDSIGADYFKTTIGGNIARIYLSQNDLAQARKYALDANAIAIKLKNFADATATFEILKTIAQKQGNTKLALQYFEQYKQYADSLNSTETRKNMLSLETKYQTGLKEKQIAELRSANAEKELAVVKTNRLLVIASVAGIAIVSVLLLLYRNSNHQKKLAQKEHLLQQQQVQFLERQQQVISLQSMINGQETERTRIAKDLHDGLGGLFSTVKMHFSTLQHEVSELKENDLFNKSYSLVDTASVELRRIAHNMMPEVLMKLGLVQALQDLCNNINAGRLLHISLQAYGMEQRFVSSTEIMLYRIIQELINNIIKHANATEAIVQFNLSGNTLTVTVEDNGRGFDVNETHSTAGIESVKSRVSYLNGQINIDSDKNVGTTVMMEFLINNHS